MAISDRDLRIHRKPDPQSPVGKRGFPSEEDTRPAPLDTADNITDEQIESFIAEIMQVTGIPNYKIAREIFYTALEECEIDSLESLPNLIEKICKKALSGEKGIEHLAPGVETGYLAPISKTPRTIRQLLDHYLGVTHVQLTAQAPQQLTKKEKIRIGKARKAYFGGLKGWRIPWQEVHGEEIDWDENDTALTTMTWQLNAFRAGEPDSPPWETTARTLEIATQASISHMVRAILEKDTPSQAKRASLTILISMHLKDIPNSPFDSINGPMINNHATKHDPIWQVISGQLTKAEKRYLEREGNLTAQTTNLIVNYLLKTGCLPIDNKEEEEFTVLERLISRILEGRPIVLFERLTLPYQVLPNGEFEFPSGYAKLMAQVVNLQMMLDIATYYLKKDPDTLWLIQSDSGFKALLEGLFGPSFQHLGKLIQAKRNLKYLEGVNDEFLKDPCYTYVLHIQSAFRHVNSRTISTIAPLIPLQLWLAQYLPIESPNILAHDAAEYVNRRLKGEANNTGAALES